MQIQLISRMRCSPENMCRNRFLKIESQCKHYADFNTNRNQILLYGKQLALFYVCKVQFSNMLDYFTKNNVVNSKLTYFHQHLMKIISTSRFSFL